MVVLLTGSLNFGLNIQTQKIVFFILPLLPIFIIFFIGSIAETNRAPFDLAEAESELVSGFMTEHSAVIFVFFFLAEYASIVLICILASILFLGGYLFDINIISDIVNYLAQDYTTSFQDWNINNYIYNPILSGIFFSLSLAIKTCIMIFTFIWARASFPRIRFDQLMSFCWTVLLPIVIAFIVFVPCLIYSLEIIPSNTIF